MSNALESVGRFPKIEEAEPPTGYDIFFSDLAGCDPAMGTLASCSEMLWSCKQHLSSYTAASWQPTCFYFTNNYQNLRRKRIN